jgi:sterol desaturase/sphingolipid hydroxylase (fatty acid hydroxylase superfamily)
MTEPWLRPIAFAISFLIMFVLESVVPRRKRTENRVARTWNNLLLSCINTVAFRFIPFLSAVGAAQWAESRSIGLFHWWNIPVVLQYALVVILFDLLIYWQHVAFHRLPLLWRIHQVHHADHDLDASSGLRFHPLEIAISMLVKCLAVIALGASPASVILFEVLLNSCSIFNHSNLKLPVKLDHFLRILVVTPDMHRVHHSIYRDETRCNYGFNIPWWDRLFQTYKAQPREPHELMRLGVPEFPESQQTIPILSMLLIPFAASQQDDSIAKQDKTQASR